MADNHHLLIILSDGACIALFFIPSYYATQADAVFLDAETLGDTVHKSTTSEVNAAEDIQHPAQQQSPIPSTPRAHLQAESTLLRAGNDALPSAIPGNLNPNTSSLAIIRNKWVIYVEQCCHGWRVIVGIATSCLLGLPPFLQFAGPKDAIVRGLIYISIIHFSASLASALTLAYYFHKEHFRASKFAMDWYNSAKQYRKLYSQMPWILLGVPAIFSCWAIAFVILALATSVWRGGISLPDPLPTDKDDRSVTVVRSIVSVLFLADAACVAVLFRKLRALAE